MSKTEWTKKIIIIVIGSIIAAYGITLALYAGFGGATLAVLWQGISRTFHISIGMASLIVAIIMIVFSFFYDRSQIHIGTIIYQLVYSLCVDFVCKCTCVQYAFVGECTDYVVGSHAFCSRNRSLCGSFTGTWFLRGINLFSCGKERLAGKSSADDTGYCYGTYRSFAGGKVWHMYNRNDHYLRTDYSVYSIKS